MDRRLALRAASGFTLLEMLVVLAIAAMVSTLLFQGLAQVFRLETQFGQEVFATQRGAMYADWFRQSIAGLMPDQKDGPNRFSGTARELRGMTVAPLDIASESLAPFAWRLRFVQASGMTQLAYGRDDDAPVIMSWHGNTGAFVYVDDEHKVHDSWPPPLGQSPQLPRAIYLETREAAEPRVLVAAPHGPVDALPRRREVE